MLPKSGIIYHNSVSNITKIDLVIVVMMPSCGWDVDFGAESHYVSSIFLIVESKSECSFVACEFSCVYCDWHSQEILSCLLHI